MTEKIGIFTEAFRPRVIDDLVLPERISNLFREGNGVDQHYLFYSPKPGSGKSTLAKILAKDYSSLYINVSDESSVEVIRGKIKSFSEGADIFEGNYVEKMVILDEIHGASQQFFDALLGVTEQFASHVRFIATCNYLNKIPENVRSRFECIDFAAIDEVEEKALKTGLAKRAVYIIKKAGMKIDKPALKELVYRNFPDMRSIINKINYFYKQGKTEILVDDVIKSTYSDVEIFEICLGKNSIEIYKKVINKYSGKSDDVLTSLGNEFILWLEEEHPTKATNPTIIASIIDVVTESSYKRNFVIDKMLNLTNCIFKIQQIMNNN